MEQGTPANQFEAILFQGTFGGSTQASKALA